MLDGIFGTKQRSVFEEGPVRRSTLFEVVRVVRGNGSRKRLYSMGSQGFLGSLDTPARLPSIALVFWEAEQDLDLYGSTLVIGEL